MKAGKINEHCDYGDRLAIKHKDIRNIKEVVDDFVRNRAIWNNWYDELSYETNWHDAEFLVNFTSNQTLVNNPFGLIPHQDTYLRFQLPSRFGVVIYLNTPEECEEAQTSIVTLVNKDLKDPYYMKNSLKI